MANDSYNLLGQNGSQDINATDGALTFSGTARPRAVAAAGGASVTFSTLTDDIQEGTQRTLVVGAGEIRYGLYSAITVSSGVAVAYL